MHLSVKPIAVRNPSGIQFRLPVSPSSWHGQAGCIVGPFSSSDIAQYFTRRVLNDPKHPEYEYRVFVKGCEWYVEIQGIQALAAG